MSRLLLLIVLGACVCKNISIIKLLYKEDHNFHFMCFFAAFSFLACVGVINKPSMMSNKGIASIIDCQYFFYLSMRNSSGFI